MNRLMVIADHSVVIHAIRLALRQTAGFRVVGFVDGRGSVESQLVEHRPDVVLLDDMHEPAQALERLGEIAEHVPGARIVLLARDVEAPWLDEAFDAGVQAVISKTVHAVALGTLLREIVNGTVVQRSRPVAAEVPEECPLTAREREILDLAARGLTNGRIARELWVTEQTVKFHLSNTYRKIGVANRTEASRYAYLNRLVSVGDSLAS